MGTYPVVGEGLLGAEIERLTSLRDQLLDSANRLNAMRLDGWSGAAAEAFEAARYTLCRELYRTADQHEDAARHLAEYDAVRQRVLALASEIRSEWPGAMPPDAAGHVDWLWGQLAAAAHQAAAGIRAAATALGDVRRQLPDIQSDPVDLGPPPAPIARSPAPVIVAGPPTLDLSTAREHAVLAELRHSPHFMIDLPVRP
ncbi:MAG TPA: hypothetical protein VF892_20830 [Pseudonocardiaceae bacterium]